MFHSQMFSVFYRTTGRLSGGQNGTTRSLQTLDGIHFLSWQSENEGVRSIPNCCMHPQQLWTVSPELFINSGRDMYLTGLISISSTEDFCFFVPAVT